MGNIFYYYIHVIFTVIYESRNFMESVLFCFFCLGTSCVFVLNPRFSEDQVLDGRRASKFPDVPVLTYVVAELL